MKLPIINMVFPIQAKLLETHNEVQKKHKVLLEMTACRVGCSHCCSRKVTLTVAEALILYHYLREKGVLSKVLAKCEEYEKEYKEYDDQSWFLSNIKCPVLNMDLNTCEAYQVRPVFCSTHYAMNNSESCDPWYTGPLENYPIDYLEEAKKFYLDVIKLANPAVVAYVTPIYQGLLVAHSLQKTPDLSLETIIKALG